MRKQTIIVALVCLLLTGLYPFARLYSRMDRSLVSSYDALIRQVETVARLVIAPVHSHWIVLQNVEAIEKKNRQLYTELSRCQINQSANVDSTASAQLKDEKLIHAKISQFAGHWIILSGKNDGVERGDLVLINGVYLGVVDVVSNVFATLETVHDQVSPLVVLHSRTRTSGLYSLQAGWRRVAFTQVIPDLQEGDTISTTPDGRHTKESFPIGIVSSVETKSSDSVSKVLLTPIAQPKVFDDVVVLRSM